MARMTIDDALIRCIDTRDAAAAGRIADQLRFQHGMTYNQIMQRVLAVRPNAGGQWEDMMEEADDLESDE